MCSTYEALGSISHITVEDREPVLKFVGSRNGMQDSLSLQGHEKHSIKELVSEIIAEKMIFFYVQ